MDIKREPPRKRGKYIMIGVGVAVLGVTTVALGNLEQRPPSVDRATLWIDSVQRGTMTRAVRAPGTLTPERIRYVVAVTSGRVEALPVRPGVTVSPSTIVLELSDPNVQQAMFEIPDSSVPAGTVVQVVQAGYMIGERVLRPALVGVSKGGAKSAPPSQDKTDDV